MREILFRGKRLDNGEWVHGFLMERPMQGKVYILKCSQDRWCEVDANTVGQYTGLKDKNGKRIFEGDIVEVSWSAPMRETVYEKYEVVYSKSGFFAKRNGKLYGQISNYIYPNVNMR